MTNGAEISEIQPNEPEPIPLHRGIWAETISNGQLLPVGGSLFDTQLTLKMRTDFDSFEGDLQNYRKKIEEHYEKNKDGVSDWLKSVGSDIDPHLFYVCHQAQQKMEQLLQVDRDNPPNSFERLGLYTKGAPPNLSDLKGKSECAEQVVLGKELLRRLGFDTAYMSGIAMENPQNGNEWPEDHSFLVLKEPNKPNSLIFDIARPRSQHNLPRLLRTDFPISPDTFKGKQDGLVRATEVLQGGQLYYGVGWPTAGGHAVLKVA